eukprot:TRINITY_DN43706_c0_g1_i1.p1 TRINITY_DN43706_c0_g1~~TRINITY_DN43706_c0_g1_i1.p1  ORF type:complete len:444 (-),score=57.61 TRINITY_DN43706_c0_g1_i1:266-1597(-)
MSAPHPATTRPLLPASPAAAASAARVMLPVTEKHCCKGYHGDLGLLWGVAEMQGWRPTMEDAYIALGSLTGSRSKPIDEHEDAWSTSGLFAVFDGHGGSEISKFCAENLPRIITCGNASEPAGALYDAFVRLDDVLKHAAATMSPAQVGHPDNVGCTAVACLVQQDTIIVANAGDSRAVLCRNGKAIECSQDHKPGLQTEAARIQRAGGYIVEQNLGTQTIHRINGDLSLSRSIGDLRFKKNHQLPFQEQMVSCVPDMFSFNRQLGDEFLVLACDGIWDVLSSQQVVDCVRMDLDAIRRDELHPSDVVCKLLDSCLASDPMQTGGIGGDNMTMIIVIFEDANGCSPTSTSLQSEVSSAPTSSLVVRSYVDDSESPSSSLFGRSLLCEGDGQGHRLGTNGFRRNLWCEDDSGASRIKDELAAVYQAGDDFFKRLVSRASSFLKS